MTADNRFSMPFLIEPAEAGSAIADGIERDRTEIVFPLPMALLMKAARRPGPPLVEVRGTRDDVSLPQRRPPLR